jgi:transaldolase
MGKPEMSISIKIFSDGANLDDMLLDSKNPLIKGITTNPTLMASAGITDYLGFAKTALSQIKEIPISLEVFSDDFDEMYNQAKILDSLGDNVYVKIPIVNTNGDLASDVIKSLSSEGVKLNITAIFTSEQLQTTYDNLNSNTASIISIFAGRIANTGLDPEPFVAEAVRMFADKHPHAEILWASTRELFNVIQADRCGCHIITMTPKLISDLNLFGKNLTEYSIETVQMFYDDAVKSGFKL